MNIKLSFIIPAYNVGKTIKRCVLSIVNQNLKDYEIIIVDDCSIDSTAEVVEELRKENDVIRYFKQKKNSGPGAARNRGLKEARGEYIEFVDGDDYLKENTISKVLDRMEKEKSDLLIFGFEAFGFRSTTHFNFVEGVYSQREFLEVLKERFIGGIFNSCFNKIYKKDLLTYEFPTSTYIGEDIAFNADNFKNFQKIVVVSDECYMYDNTQSSLVRSNYKLSLEKIDFMCGKCIESFSSRGLNEEEMAFIYFYYGTYIIDDFIFSKAYKKTYKKFKEIMEKYQHVFELASLYTLSTDNIVNLIVVKKYHKAYQKTKNRAFKKIGKAVLKKIIYRV